MGYIVIGGFVLTALLLHQVADEIRKMRTAHQEQRESIEYFLKRLTADVANASNVITAKRYDSASS